LISTSYLVAEVGVTMAANRDYRARAGASSERQDGGAPYELVVVCMSSILGVAVTALLIWLALGGRF
jgi:hypothetical protein